MKAVALALFLAGAANGYTGSAACGQCHQAIAESYKNTAMARSFRAVQPGIRLPEFDGRAFLHQASRQTFTPVTEAGRYLVSRQQSTSGFQPFRMAVDYILGSGDHARSYLHKAPDNALLELPVSWYARRGGYWEMSPGYDRAGHQGFTREVNARCLFCHNAYPQKNKLGEGIDCERCHGPGDQHVKDAKRASIVNPARLPAERSLEVCLQCHLETTSGDLPGSRLRPGRDVFSYRPGEPLGDYQQYLDHAPDAGQGEKFEIVSSAYRMRQAACYRARPEKLGCTACHDVHRQMSRAETVAKTQQVCTSCHAQTQHEPSGDCVNCHMPTRETEDVPHVEMTDHKIGIGLRPFTALVRRDDVPYGGDVVAYYPPGGTVGITTAPPLSPKRKDYTANGQALLRAGKVTAAVAAFRTAVNTRPEVADIRVNLAAALIAQNDYPAAQEQLEEAIRTGPSIEVARGAWLAARKAGAPLPTAREKYDDSLRTQMLSAHSNLGVVLDHMGDHEGAIKEFRRAVECDPSSAAAKQNLRQALTR